MYITDLSHFLDEKGAIGPKSGARAPLAEFLADVVAAATAPARYANRCDCSKCKGMVGAAITRDDSIEWLCSSCGQAGRIANWRGSFWDLSETRYGGR